MGAVWLAQDQLLGRPVAIKQLLTLDSGHIAAQRFAREVRLAGQLNNPFIVTVYDVFHDNGVPHVVMELLDGADRSTRRCRAPGRETRERHAHPDLGQAVLTEQPTLDRTRDPLLDVISGLLAPTTSRLDADSARILLERVAAGPTSRERPQQRRKRLILGSAAAVTAAAAIIAAVTLWPTDDDQAAAPSSPARTAPATTASSSVPVQVVARCGPGHRLRLNHLTDLTVITYPDARHEVFNETTRAEITTAMLDRLRTPPPPDPGPVPVVRDYAGFSATAR
jgi:hypothetical protein